MKITLIYIFILMLFWN